MSPAPTPDWRHRAASLSIDARAFIGGRRFDALSGEIFEVISPINGKSIAKASRCRADDVNAAVISARTAFDGGVWATQPPAQRKRVLLKWADKIIAARDELALLETLDMGKPIRFSHAVDVYSTARCIQWYAEAVDKVYDEIAPTPNNALGLIRREPMGVIAAIVPWNYPMLMASWKLGPALAAGNSVVLKPSEKSPLTAMRLAELAVEAGLPPGVFNVVPGFGAEAGEALALHLGVDAIAFTGSTRTGRKMLEYSSRSNLKRVFNELGGKSANIIFPDFNEMERAVATAAGSVFFNQGESCNAPSRLLVQESIADSVIEKIVAQTPRYAPSDPLDPNTVMGAMVDEAQLRSVMGFVNSGKLEGARCLIGGTIAHEKTGGVYMNPTVFDNVKNDMKIAREEIFGPVLSIIRFKDEAEAIRIANDSTYGLHAGVWTNNLDRAHRVAAALRVGTVHVNSYDEDDMTVPFGGYKQSGNGRDKSLHALDKYTELKTTWIRLSAK